MIDFAYMVLIILGGLLVLVLIISAIAETAGAGRQADQEDASVEASALHIAAQAMAEIASGSVSSFQARMHAQRTLDRLGIEWTQKED